MKSIYVLIFTLALPAISYADGIGNSDKLDQNGILRSNDGSIHYMNYSDAMNACPAGTHLPTIRELAQEAQALGAKGIIETSQYQKLAYLPVSASAAETFNQDGRHDKFYFDAFGYPTGDLGPKNWLWSSSPSLDHKSTYVLDSFGFMYEDYFPLSEHAVHCALDSGVASLGAAKLAQTSAGVASLGVAKLTQTSAGAVAGTDTCAYEDAQFLKRQFNTTSTMGFVAKSDAEAIASCQAAGYKDCAVVTQASVQRHTFFNPLVITNFVNPLCWLSIDPVSGDIDGNGCLSENASWDTHSKAHVVGYKYELKPMETLKTDICGSLGVCRVQASALGNAARLQAIDGINSQLQCYVGAGPNVLDGTIAMKGSNATAVISESAAKSQVDAK